MPLVLGPDGARLAKRHGDVTLREVDAAAPRWRWMARVAGLARRARRGELLDGVRPGARCRASRRRSRACEVRAVGVVLALIGGFGIVVTMGAFVLSSVCWEYCEDEPTVGDALQFALPFGLITLAFLTAAAHLLDARARLVACGRWPSRSARPCSAAC